MGPQGLYPMSATIRRWAPEARLEVRCDLLGSSGKASQTRAWYLQGTKKGGLWRTLRASRMTGWQTQREIANWGTVFLGDRQQRKKQAESL